MRYLIIIFSILLLANTSIAEDDNQYLFVEISKIAEAGNPEAQYHLGMLFNNGIGTEKDFGQAFYWFEKSAEAGDPLGHYKVGCYYSGQGNGVVETDNMKALEHKLIAAKSGYVLAQHDVASAYYLNGDISQAVPWWERAAKQGDRDSVIALFTIYSEGRGIPKDLKKAYGYLKIIENNIGEDQKTKAKAKLVELKNKLSPKQLEEAENFSLNWNPEETELTVKAFSGIRETRRIIETAKK